MTFSIHKLEGAIRNILFFILISWMALVMGHLIWSWGDSASNITLPKVSITSTDHIKPLPTVSGNLFGLAVITEMEKEQPLTETQLNLLLRGVLPSNQQDQSIAFISAQGQPDKPYRVGDSVSSGVTLHSVFTDRVILSRGGIKEVLYFAKTKDTLLIEQHSSQIAPIVGTGLREPSSIQESTRSKALFGNNNVVRQTSSTSAFMKDVISMTPAAFLDRYETEFQNNPESILASAGLIATGRSYKVVSGSPLSRVGLRTGDEIVSVNGQAVGDFSSDKTLGTVIRSQKVARIEIRRNERRFYVNYAVK